eukprot:GAHX01000221.1.p1 GENE.GAHX01000221.1~~GAHX01000221.1.p1  ORF type:complete len:321 (-),score=39.09 GAHX01000221.1:104-1066(-)
MGFFHRSFLYIMHQEWSSVKLKEAKWLLIMVYIFLFSAPIIGLILTITLTRSEKITRLRYYDIKHAPVVGIDSETTINLPSELPQGEYTVYYVFDHFFQNNRSFYWSYSLSQLLHRNIEDTSNCGEYSKHDSRVIYPCGAIANQFFNDSIKLSYNTTGNHWKDIPITFPDFDSSIFKGYVENFSADTITEKNAYRLMQRTGLDNTKLPMPQNLLFLEWLRPNITHTVFKRYGDVTIKETLIAGKELKIKYVNNFELNKGDKFIVFVPRGYSLVDKKANIAIQSAAAALIVFMFLSTILGFNEEMFKPKTQKYTDVQFDFY